jgi:hypothetical protein
VDDRDAVAFGAHRADRQRDDLPSSGDTGASYEVASFARTIAPRVPAGPPSAPT